MKEVIVFGDIVEENGKTIRQNNMEKQHKYKVGDLVEVKMSDWHDDGACSITHARLWIVNCGRDCDGTPLYSLSPTPRHKWDNIIIENHDEGWRTKEVEDDGMSLGQKIYYKCKHGYPEESLTKIEVNDALREGYNSLSWDRKEPKPDSEFLKLGSFNSISHYETNRRRLDTSTPDKKADFLRWFYKDGKLETMLLLPTRRPGIR